MPSKMVVSKWAVLYRGLMSSPGSYDNGYVIWLMYFSSTNQTIKMEQNN